MLQLQIVNINVRLCLLEKFCLKNIICMMKAKLSFFRTSYLNDYDFHGNKATILYLIVAHF